MTQTWTPSTPIGGSAGGAESTSARQVCKSISTGGAQIRVLLKASATVDTNLLHVSLGKLGASQPNTIATPVELKFSGASGIYIPAGTSVWSDWLDFSTTAGDTLVVIADYGATGGNFAWNGWPPPSPSNADEWYKYSTASWDQATVSGFAQNVGLCVLVDSIEVQSAPPPPPPPPSLLNIVSEFTLAQSNDGANANLNAFLGGSVSGLEWATAEMGAGVNGVSWLGQKFRSPKEIRRITWEHKDAATSVSSVHVLYGSDPATLSVAGPFAVGMNAAVDLPALGSHTYWRIRANSAPADRWHVRRCYMSANVNEWDATPTWVQAYINFNTPWTANSNVVNGEPQALQIVPMDARWADAFDEFDPVTYRYTAKRAGKINCRVRLQINGTGVSGIHLHAVKNADPSGGFYRPVYHGNGNWGFDICIPVAIGDFIDVRLQIEQGTNIVIEGHRSLFEVF